MGSLKKFQEPKLGNLQRTRFHTNLNNSQTLSGFQLLSLSLSLLPLDIKILYLQCMLRDIARVHVVFIFLMVLTCLCLLGLSFTENRRAMAEKRERWREEEKERKKGKWSSRIWEASWWQSCGWGSGRRCCPCIEQWLGCRKAALHHCWWREFCIKLEQSSEMIEFFPSQSNAPKLRMLLL